MNKLLTKISSSANKVGFKLKKHSPEILVVTGVVGVVASTIIACRATTKASKVLEQAKKDIDQIHDCEANEALTEQYTPEDVKKDLAVVYLQTGIKIVKLYAPAVILGTLSIGCILKSNNILSKRNVALTAAYATVDKGFKEYRNRVIERFGEQVDHEIRHNIKSQTIEKKVVDENGKEKKVKETIEVAGVIDEASNYARYFDKQTSRCCEGIENYDYMFLKAQQQFANDRLKAYGRLFLNDVYKDLGIEPTPAGQVVGWVYDPDNPNHIGDDYIDFGIREVYRETEDERTGEKKYEKAILMDFNVDGNVWDLWAKQSK
jgi:hypothetical protein